MKSYIVVASEATYFENRGKLLKSMNSSYFLTEITPHLFVYLESQNC